MISASEPLEFVPHGRTVLLNHPGQVFTKGHNVSLSENSLLYKLTNFAIQDDSFLEYKEEEQEWWCIREVYYRASDELEEEPSSPKDKTDFASESFRPPSRLKPDFNVSIKSELVGGIKRMETDTVTSAGQSQASSVNSSSNLSKKFNLNSGQSDTINKKPFNPVTDCSYEEELYVKGCTAVWSKGLISTPGSKLTNSESRETICCYTLENPIKHATFCNFHVSINNTMLIDALNSQIGDVKKNIKIEDTTEHIKTKILPSILLVDNKCIKVFAKDGREYIASIPFQVKKVWPMKYGVLLEKEATPMLQNSMYATSFFKLNESHNNSTFMKSKSNIPLNMSAKLRAESVSGYDQDVPLPTCFSLSHPLDEVTPILMKSPSSGIHYYNDGDLQIMFVSTNPSIVLIYDWKLGTHSLWHIRKATRDECLSICPTLNSTTTMFSQSCDFVGSPLQSNLGKNTTSWATGLGSPYQSKKGPSTPTLSRSRQNSPMANIFHQQGLSPHASIGQASSVSMLANTVGQSPPSLPLYPDICLDHIWTDSQTIRRDSIKNPSDCKTFLHTDLVGHEYLCFMVKVDGVSRLQIARLQRSHNHGQTSKSNLIVGSISSVAAKDAEVLDHLNMIVLVDDTGNIVLQSGNSFVGKVHIGGVLARLLHSGPGGSVYPGAASMYPRRSSLLPHGAEPAACHLLSPVPHPPRQDTNGILGIRDACGRRFTLQLCTGGMVRVWLPAPRTSICPLKCPLRPDQTRQVLIKWYGVRNAPGTQDLSPEQEWNMFSNLLYSLIGYDVEKLSEVKQNDDQTEAEVVPKKQRTSSDGTQDDWEYLLGSKLHTAIGNPLANMLNLKPVTFEIKHASKPTKLAERHAQFNTNALLFPYTFQVFFAYHLLYEETKLNTLLWSELKPLAKFLYQLAKDLKLVNYVNHYWLDFPTDFDLECEETESQITEDILAKLTPPTYFTYEPPNIFSYLNNLLLDIDVGYYPYLTDVNNMSKNLIELVAARSGAGGGVWAAGGEGRGSSTPRLPSENDPPAIFAAGITQSDIESLPCGLALVLNSIITSVRANPAVNWPAETYKLLGRDDLYTLYTKTEPDNISPLTLNVLEKETAYTLVTENVEEEKSKKDDTDINTGMEHLNTKLLKLLYPRDHRMAEVQKLLQSSIPVSIKLTQRPEVSDHDFIDEQEKHLFAVSTRTMALPIARGMITYRTVPCLGTESLSIPALTVSGRGPPPRCATVSLPGSEAAAASLVWPTFHNGVAAGLALVPVGGKIDANWVIYNKPRNGQDWSGSHGGLLMALGLMGQLRDMPFMQIYDYLVKCHDLLSCGLLLGLAATYRGTMDVQATKLVSIHLAGLLPPTSVELELQQSVACAALLAAGLLYEGTCHAHIAAVLLADIGKPPGPEMENCVEREGYSLAAGLALGMVCAGAGPALPALAPALRTYMLGGDQPARGQKDKHNQNSVVNLDVTAPGATLALGLVYLKTNNKTVASWLEPPSTSYLLEHVRPDLLLLRGIARGLIMWDSIEPSIEWVEKQVPLTISKYCFVKPTEENVDYEAMNQAYCVILTGAVVALGLKHAGSGHGGARAAALHGAGLLLALGAGRAAELCTRQLLESCAASCLLSAAMVMAGRGDLDVLRLCRRLRTKLPTAGNADALTHGGQMAVHMAAGLCFLGGGRCTLASSPRAVAALLAACFPKFPTHSEDNRYHLQAFRHLYVLAVEPRLILPRDIDTGKLCYAHIQVVDLEGAVSELKAPCIIPSLDTLKEVKINDPRYWPISFQKDRNWDQLKKFLEETWCVDIKQRAGCLSYLDDPQGFLTILAQTLTLDKSNVWSVTPENIELFTNDHKIKTFVKHYLSKDGLTPKICADCLMISRKKKGSKEGVSKTCLCRQYNVEEQEYMQGLSLVTYECVIKDVLCVLPLWMTFLKIIKTMKTEPSAYHMWQIKLLLSQIEHHNKRIMNEMKIDGQENQNESLIPTEFSLSIKQKVANIFDSCELKLNPFLRKYLGLPSSRRIDSCEGDIKKMLSCFIVFHDIPKVVLRDLVNCDELEVLLKLEGKNLSAEALSKIGIILK